MSSAQSTSVDRAANLFTSMKAAGPRLGLTELAQISDDDDLRDGELVDALAFLEGSGLIELQTFVVIGGAQ